MNVLKPCPFCGEERDLVFLTEKSRVYIHCIHCDSDSGSCSSENKAVELWNNRTDPVKDQMLEALKKSRRKHYYCEDSWYSCPKSCEGCSNDEAGDDCNCGADEWNNYVDKIIKAAEKEGL